MTSTGPYDQNNGFIVYLDHLHQQDICIEGQVELRHFLRDLSFSPTHNILTWTPAT